MPQTIDPRLKTLLLGASFRPAVTLWNRLEGRPRAEDFDRSLRAEVRDPLWMLTRQWQVGEFKGEDAGSAAKARAQVATARVNQVAVKSEDRDASGSDQWLPAVAFDADVPLETQVERERVWDDRVSSQHDGLALRGQMGRHWMRLLRTAGRGSLKDKFIERFGFLPMAGGSGATPDQQLEAAHIQSDQKVWQTLEAFTGRLPDGRRLLFAIEHGEFATWVAAEFSTAVQDVLTELAEDFRRWFYRTYSQPSSANEDAWAPPYLEYQLAVSAPADAASGSRTPLVAEEYYQGRLDWYAFDADPEQRPRDGRQAAPDPAFEERAPFAVVPTQIEFSGMPNVRWWEIEDRRTDFGSIRAGTTDLPLLTLAEFGLVYGNDWCVIPCQLPVGTLARIRGLIVTDVFGVRTLIRAAGQGMDWQPWSMYRLAARAGGPADERLFLAPAVAKIQESDPVEKVVLARDELTNLVWAIEERIPGVLGTGADGFEAATALSRFFSQRAPDTSTPLASGAAIRYVLGTSVPENWIPFVARHRPGSQRLIRLQRAAMPRLTDALPSSRIEPRGRMLRTGLDVASGEPRQPYFLHEEEVPRAGVVVTRSFQRARWFDGKVCTWIGRRKETGRRASGSGLEFDRTEPGK